LPLSFVVSLKRFYILTKFDELSSASANGKSFMYNP